MIKSILWIASKYLLAIGVLAYVAYANWEPSEGRGLRAVWHRHVVDGQPINGIYLLAAFLLQALGMFPTLFRWYILVRAQDLPITVMEALRLGTLGDLCNAFLPGSVGGDVVKATALARKQSRPTVAVATVVMDRALSVWGLIFLVACVGSVGYFFGFLSQDALGPSEVIIVTSVVIVGMTGALWLVTGWASQQNIEKVAGKLTSIPRVGLSLAHLWEAVWLYRNRPATVAWAIVLTTLSNVCDILVFYCYVRTLWDGVEANPLPGITEHFLLVPIGLVISGVPLFPGGTGIGEAGFGGLYELFGSAASNGVLGSLLFRVGGWVLGVIGYLICVAIGTKGPKGTGQPLA